MSDRINLHHDQYDSVVKLVEKIAVAGKITAKEQRIIDKRARTKLDKLDSMALTRLASLVQSGAVKPAK